MSRGASRLHLKASEAILQVEGLKKAFRFGESELVLFENLSFQVKRGEMLAIVGESGAGKSTLLHILSALDRASSGDVYCAHLRLNSLSHDEADRKSTRLNSSHLVISYAVFCLKKKKKQR